MKSFKSIREGNSDEPGVSEINDVQDDPLSFIEIKPKKSKAVKEDIHEVTDNDMAHSAHMYGLKHGREGAGVNMDRAKAQYGTL